MTGPRSFVRRLRPLVLCYHAVSGPWEDELAVEPEMFKAQVRLALDGGYTPAPVGEIVARSSRLLHVTFDDAFRNIVPSLEFLAELGVPATVFVCSDLADDGSPLPLFAQGGARAAPGGDGETLTWGELRALADDGVEIGSHTCSHPHLTEISDEELGRELTESKTRIADELGRECAYLAYPFGVHDARVRAAALRAGYAASFAQATGLLYGDAQAVYRVSLYRRDALRRVSLKMSSTGRIAAAVHSHVSRMSRT